MSGSGFLTPSGPLVADPTAYWVFSAAALLLVGSSIVLMIRETTRVRTAVPLIVFASAALWLPNEPMIDTILGFRYATDAPYVLFTLLGREIPIGALGVGAMFFLFPWAIYQMMLHDFSTRKIILICIVAGVIDWGMEIPAIGFGLFEYYGDNPSRIFGLPLTSMVQNCFLYIWMACAITLCAPRLTGWRGLAFLPVIPGMYFAAALLATWPAYLALHAEWPRPVFLPLAAVSVAMNVIIPLYLLRAAQQGLRARDLSGTRRAIRPVSAAV